MIRERLTGLANSFAGVTPERHERKVQQFREEADSIRKYGKYKVYDILDGQSVIESGRFGIGIAGAPALAALGFETIASATETGDAAKGLLGLGLVALSIRIAKLPIRANDNSNAIEQVLREDFHRRLDRITS